MHALGVYEKIYKKKIERKRNIRKKKRDDKGK